MDHKKIRKEISQYYFTVLFVILNIIIFLICTITGELLYNIGAFFVWDVVTKKEYYRLLSAVFLHYDIDHLFNNMILLFFIGRIVEKYIGRRLFCRLYFFGDRGKYHFRFMGVKN